MRVIGFLLCLLTLAAAGCGGGTRSASTTTEWRHLARTWARQADAVAQDAAAGDSCGASQKADALQSDVSARRDSVPLRYRTVLLQAVDRLASGITCAPETVTTVVTTGPQPPPHGKKPPHGPGPPGHHKHDHGGGGNEGGDGG